MADYDLLLLRQIIMDHYQYPRNRRLETSDEYHTVHMATESCIDDIKVQAKIENDILTDVCFDGVACTVSTASTSILTELMIGKTVQQAQALIDLYMDMIYLKEVDLDPLEEAVAFYQVGKQANRIKCAIIGWSALQEILDEKEGNHDES